MVPPEASAVGAAGAAGDLAPRLQAACRAWLPEAGPVEVADLQRLFGGASRETWRFMLVSRTAGAETRRPMILRRDPAASLIDTERRREVAAYRAFAEHPSVPVPAIAWLDEDPALLGSPYFVMEAITGCEAAPQRLMGPPWQAHHARLAEATWSILGQIARTPAEALARAGDPSALAGPVTPANAWRQAIDHWHTVLDQQALEPQPIAQAAIRWLRAHPPPPAQHLAVVHGDYRIGNLLVAPDGQVRAVLDWEMAHAGDPLEDLAWSMDRSWCFLGDDRVGGIATPAQAIAWWQAASGLCADPAALHWWRLLAAVKGQAIWLGAARAFAEGRNRDLMMAFAAWMLGNSQDRAILELMDRL